MARKPNQRIILYRRAKAQWRCTLSTLTTPLVNDTVIIRPAAAGDFEWVVDLMVRALSPFYGGDV